jgi:glycerol-3-phosphate acyltransferase PlsY
VVKLDAGEKESIMDMVMTTAAVVLGYLLGSFPGGYLLGRLWGVNVLEGGSGRTGGTNVLRSAGMVPALLTGALDIGKGVCAVWLAGQIGGDPTAQILAGGAAILGHNYSIFLGFRGGAGVATSLGALAAIYFPASVGLLVLLLLIIATTRRASVGSLSVMTLMPIVLLVVGLAGLLPLIYVLYGLLAWVIVVYAHRPNIQRLIQGTERRLGEKRPHVNSITGNSA